MEEKNTKQKERKGNPIWNVLKAEWVYLGDRRKVFLFYMSLYVIAGLITLSSPLVLGLVFNTIQGEISSDAEVIKIIQLISLLLVIQVGFWLFHGTARHLEGMSGFFVNRNYVNSKMKKVLELPIKWHKDNHSGDTIDKINRASGSITDFSSYYTFQIVYAALTAVVSIAILSFFDVRAAIIASVFAVIILLVVASVDKKLYKYYKELNKLGNKVSASIFDYISNINTVITLRLKRTVRKEVDDKIMASYDASRKSSWINESKWAFSSISITLMTVIVLSLKAYTDFQTTGIILIGTLYILYGYLDRVGETFFSFADLYGNMIRFDAAIDNARPIDKAFNKMKGDVGKKLPSEWQEVEIKGLEFSYEKGKKNLRDVDFKFTRGQKIALIGESGSGKSTILSVLRGLYPANKGEVFVNEQKMDHGFARLKSKTTLIPQDPEIFSNTVGFNITMDIPVKKEILERAIEMARFKNVVKRLEKGLDTSVLEKGVSLSGGEKQRLALARGLLAARRSEILLLDEPTSSVDSANEMKIHDEIFKEFKKKTIISSIHRLHLLDKFDYIYMFDRGKIVAQGTLDEMKRDERFKKIWRKYGMTREIE
tara:strand:- start:2919 stop:4712 length:1794 start_codon:yes stop_codon:yes gene_type:complete